MVKSKKSGGQTSFKRWWSARTVELMAGFWDSLKSLFGGSPRPGRSPWSDAVLSVVSRKVAARESFAPLTVATEIGATRQLTSTKEIEEICAAVRAECGKEWLAKQGYVVDQRGVYLPAERAPAPVKQAAAAPSKRASTSVEPPPTTQAPNPFDHPEILALSADELRKRALKVQPWRTAWIGRVDTIPPQTDERTAIIDRGLILRGLLTEDEVREIHRVGDLWIKHRLDKGQTAANMFAGRVAQEAVDEARAERAAKKAEKKRLAKERDERRAAEIAERKATDIVFLGPGVSSKLGDRRSNIEALERAKLPVLATPADLAKALELSVPQLRWLAFHSEAAERPHYVYFEIPKRSGGKRLLSSPLPDLAKAQRWILDQILAPLPVGAPAHGFVPGRSTVTNAEPHVGQDVVVNLDLSDFFPSITFPRVRGLFERLGYSPAVSTVLALLCTEAPRTAADYDGKRYWVATGPRGLPQGACTSPAISNQIARKLDRRLTGMSSELGFQYTRYADDLTFSAAEGKRPQLGILIAKVRHIVEDEGFKLNPKKGRVQRSGGRQTVTGIVVNEKLSVPREEVRRLRAILHSARKTGLAAQNREGIPHFESWLKGKIAYLSMVEPEKGFAMMREFEALTTHAKVA